MTNGTTIVDAAGRESGPLSGEVSDWVDAGSESDGGDGVCAEEGMCWTLRCGLWYMTGVWRRRMLPGCEVNLIRGTT